MRAIDFLGKLLCVSLAGLVWWHTKSLVWALLCAAIVAAGWCIVNWNNEESWNE